MYTLPSSRPAVGVIAEYNPFHNGHRWHLHQAKELTKAPYCIVAMSGSFVQRGEPAIVNKYARTGMALLNGADLVLEIPAPCSTASAREFASYGVLLLDALGVVGAVCFGSECGDPSLLQHAADLFSEEPPAFRENLRQLMKQGLSFPKARSLAAARILQESASTSPDSLDAVLSSPNNILGMEYLRAMREIGSSMTTVTVRRSDRGYHDLTAEGNLASATAIRWLLNSEQPESAKPLVPETAWPLMDGEFPMSADALSSILNYKIRQTLHQGGSQALAVYEDMTPELAARIQHMEPGFRTFTQWIQELKTKQVTYSHISRALLHLALDIRREDMDLFKRAGYAPYARILGFRRDAAPLLSQIKANSQIPLVAKLADAEHLLSEPALCLLKQEIHASHVYETIRQEHAGGTFKNEYRQPVVIV